MRKLFISLFFVFLCSFIHAQTNQEIAGVYIDKAEENYKNSKIAEAQIDFNKAMKLLDTITKSSVARMGTLIEFELKNYEEAQKYAKQYFVLASNKKSDEYNQLLVLYVSIQEQIEKNKLAFQKQEAIRMAQEKELQRVDSLKTVWQNMANAFTINAETVSDFNKDGIAVFKTGDNFGLIDDSGKIIVAPDLYKDAQAFDGYILLMNKLENPTQIYCYDSSAKSGFLLPSITEFNTLSTHYGKVMLPRSNGRIISYPNNSLKAMVFDIASKKFVNVANQKDLFKELKKTDKIERYKDEEVRIGGQWYHFGGHLGGGIYPLYLADYNLYGFLCAVDGRVLPVREYYNLGAFSDEKAEAINADGVFWINQNGTKVSEAKNKSGKYTGLSKLLQLENGKYQIQQEQEGKQYLVLGDQKLALWADFIKEHPAPNKAE